MQLDEGHTEVSASEKKIITRFLMSVEQFKLRSEDFFCGLI